eukprot:TRINITY_DN21217_c0_g1_i1.p1 TRINITY_DN21217_c0_g1~~TRINITY_DN21217_c0_g1_i1.p1  ORF type:complete len:552 (+),score=126.51 TRINITY_DN21217_c0_g1_i1:110-1765(+)
MSSSGRPECVLAGLAAAGVACAPQGVLSSTAPSGGAPDVSSSFASSRSLQEVPSVLCLLWGLHQAYRSEADGNEPDSIHSLDGSAAPLFSAAKCEEPISEDVEDDDVFDPLQFDVEDGRWDPLGMVLREIVHGQQLLSSLAEHAGSTGKFAEVSSCSTRCDLQSGSDSCSDPDSLPRRPLAEAAKTEGEAEDDDDNSDADSEESEESSYVTDSEEEDVEAEQPQPPARPSKEPDRQTSPPSSAAEADRGLQIRTSPSKAPAAATSSPVPPWRDVSLSANSPGGDSRAPPAGKQAGTSKGATVSRVVEERRTGATATPEPKQFQAKVAEAAGVSGSPAMTPQVKPLRTSSLAQRSWSAASAEDCPITKTTASGVALVASPMAQLSRGQASATPTPWVGGPAAQSRDAPQARFGTDNRQRGAPKSNPEPKQSDGKGWTLQRIMQRLEELDQRQVLLVRKIKHMGFNAPKELKRHYSQFGTVDKVYIPRSLVQTRARPAHLGFIVMAEVEQASAILALGIDQIVGGGPISVHPFEHQAAKVHNDDSGTQEAQAA